MTAASERVKVLYPLTKLPKNFFSFKKFPHNLVSNLKANLAVWPVMNSWGWSLSSKIIFENRGVRNKIEACINSKTGQRQSLENINIKSENLDSLKNNKGNTKIT